MISYTLGARPVYGPVYEGLTPKPPESQQDRYEFRDGREIAPPRIVALALGYSTLWRKPLSRRPAGLRATFVVPICVPIATCGHMPTENAPR